MKREWILVMDSGKGGLWTLKEIQKLLPHKNYLYFMDSLHCPYGNKSVKFLKRHSLDIIKKLTSLYNIKLVVLACNTLSTVCYDFLCQNISVPIVKIEPYFPPKVFHKQNTLVIATTNTIKHNVKIKQYNDYQNIFVFGFDDLAKKIDMANGNYDLLQDYLKNKLSCFLNVGIKNIVLGCTHFNYIKQQLTNIFGDVKFYENSKNVAKNVKNLVKISKKSQIFEKIPQKKQKKGKILLLQKI